MPATRARGDKLSARSSDSLKGVCMCAGRLSARMLPQGVGEGSMGSILSEVNALPHACAPRVRAKSHLASATPLISTLAR